MENNPQIVFERLFGDGSTDAQRQERRQQARSLLDSIRDQVPSLEKDLPAGDRRRLRDYLDEVREIERRVKQVDAKLSANLDLPDVPVGIPADFEDHLKLMFDLQVLAYKAEITRISTLMLARENSNAVYPASGVREGFHNASHHSNERQEHGPVRGASTGTTSRCWPTSWRSCAPRPTATATCWTTRWSSTAAA